jgi:hypothetical protein
LAAHVGAGRVTQLGGCFAIADRSREASRRFAQPRFRYGAVKLKNSPAAAVASRQSA